MAELTTDSAPSSSCCSAEAQATCCEPVGEERVLRHQRRLQPFVRGEHPRKALIRDHAPEEYDGDRPVRLPA
jgi:hypothetical protein